MVGKRPATGLISCKGGWAWAARTHLVCCWMPIRNIFIYLCLIYMGGNGGMKGWKERGRVKGASGGERSAHSRSPSFWRVKTSINWVCGRVRVRSAIQASASPGCSEIWSISLRRQIRWEKISLLLSSIKQKKNLRQRRLYIKKNLATVR